MGLFSGNYTMDQEIKRPYRDPNSAIFVAIVAILTLIGGIVLLVLGLGTGAKGSEIVLGAGAGAIIMSALLFIISDLSCDVHRTRYLLLTLTMDNQDYQEEIIRLLRENSRKQQEEKEEVKEESNGEITPAAP